MSRNAALRGGPGRRRREGQEGRQRAAAPLADVQDPPGHAALGTTGSGRPCDHAPAVMPFMHRIGARLLPLALLGALALSSSARAQFQPFGLFGTPADDDVATLLFPSVLLNARLLKRYR